MEPEGDDQLKYKRYTRLAIIAGFLLALLWPLGGFFGWILGGCTTYFIFLTFYYYPRKRIGFRQEGHRQSQSYRYENVSASPEAKKKSRLIFFLIAGAIVMTALTIFVTIFSLLNSSFESSPTESADWQNLRDNPTDINALTNIGNQFYANAQYDSALVYYDRVLQIDDQNSSAMFNKALVFYQQKNYSKSMEWGRKCVSMYPENVDAYTLVGDAYYEQQNLSEALGWYQKAYDKGARNPELLSIMAYVFDQQNNRNEAIRLYKETLQQDSNRVDIYNRLAELEPGTAGKYRALAERWK